MEKQLNNVFEKFRNLKGTTIDVLQSIQEIYGYLPEDALEKFSISYKVPLSEIYGVATFYSQFKFEKPGEYQIRVCHGTACHINDAVKMSTLVERELQISDGETTDDGKFSLENVACLGCCSLAPVVMINDKVYGNLTEKKLRTVLKEYRKKEVQK